MSRIDSKPNPLAANIRDELEPLLMQIDEHSGGLVLDFDCDPGLQYDLNAPTHFRASTNDELLPAKFTFSISLHVEVTDDLVEQLTGWLEECASLLDIARVTIGRNVTDTRDRGALRKLLEEPAAA